LSSPRGCDIDAEREIDKRERERRGERGGVEEADNEKQYSLAYCSS